MSTDPELFEDNQVATRPGRETTGSGDDPLPELMSFEEAMIRGLTGHRQVAACRMHDRLQELHDELELSYGDTMQADLEEALKHIDNLGGYLLEVAYEVRLLDEVRRTPEGVELSKEALYRLKADWGPESYPQELYQPAELWRTPPRFVLSNKANAT